MVSFFFDKCYSYVTKQNNVSRCEEVHFTKNLQTLNKSMFTYIRHHPDASIKRELLTNKKVKNYDFCKSYACGFLHLLVYPVLCSFHKHSWMDKNILLSLTLTVSKKSGIWSLFSTQLYTRDQNLHKRNWKVMWTSQNTFVLKYPWTRNKLWSTPCTARFPGLGMATPW